ncbi:hypothetical protein COCNU_scaffold000528G000020 [Cocos nucifera]|nr:hypothetical protein [Cocos nucifera]
MATPEATPSTEVLSITKGKVGGEDPQPPAPSGLPIGGSVLEPLNERVGDDKKKKRAAIVKEMEASKVQGDLWAKVDSLRGKVGEAKHLTEEKAAENEDLQGALRREELISTGLKAALILEEEKKEEAKIRVAKLEAQMSKSTLEVAARAMEEFKASSEMKDLNIAFG